MILVSGLGCRAWDFGEEIRAHRYTSDRVSDFGLRVSGFGFRVSGFRFRVSSFGYGIKHV